MLGRHKPEPSEPFPDDTWKFFSDDDVMQLVIDATAELQRRWGITLRQLEKALGMWQA